MTGGRILTVKGLFTYGNGEPVPVVNLTDIRLITISDLRGR